MFPDEYSRLGNNVFMAALFISNFELMRETGYFSPDASSNPLLHLWSLGIEEQFYLFWPIVLAVAWRRSVSPKLACWTLLICSLAYSAATARSNSTVFFYSPLTRSWELLIGAALALHSSTARSKLAANVAASSGIFLIITAAFLLSKASVFPTALGLLPTIGTALILWAGLRARISASILSRGPMVALGIISYPLYLWHWVLFSYAGMLHGSATTTYLRVFLIGLSVLLAWLTYFYVERPFRFGRLKPHAPALLLAIMSLCAFSGYLVSRLNGIPERRTEREREFLDFFENDAPGCQYFLRVGLFRKWRTECAFFNLAPDLAGSPVENRRDSKPVAAIAEYCYQRDERREHAVMLWGDSHVTALSPGLQEYLPKDWQLLQVSTLECPPSIDQQVPSTTNQCDQNNYFAVKTVKESKPDVVVVAQNEDHSPEKLQRIATFLRELGVRRVILVGPVPHWAGELPHILARSRLFMPRRLKDHLVSKHRDLNNILKRALPNDAHQKYADLMQLLCNDQGCLTYLGDDVKSTITTWDYGHLTPFASEFVARELLVDLITSAK